MNDEEKARYLDAEKLYGSDSDDSEDEDNESAQEEDSYSKVLKCINKDFKNKIKRT